MYFPETTKLSKCAAYPWFWCFFFSLCYVYSELSLELSSPFSLFYKLSSVAESLSLTKGFHSDHCHTNEQLQWHFKATQTSQASTGECRGCFPERNLLGWRCCWMVILGKCWKGWLWSCWESDRDLLLYWGRVLSSRLGKKNLSKRRVLKDKKEVVWMGAAAETGLSHPKCLCALLLQLSSGEISLSSSSVSSSSTVCMANKRDWNVGMKLQPTAGKNMACS